MRKIIEERILIVLILLVVIWIGFLYGCSAQYHLIKYQKKGGTCGQIDTIQTVHYDTVTNSYYFRDSLVIVNDRVVPLTRTEIRYRYKTTRDTIKLTETKIKYQFKQAKQQRKTDTQWSKTINLALWVGLILIVLFILAKIFKRFI